MVIKRLAKSAVVILNLLHLVKAVHATYIADFFLYLINSMSDILTWCNLAIADRTDFFIFYIFHFNFSCF